MLTEIAELDDVLNAHALALGSDFAGYRNHAYRMMNLCLALSPSGDRKKIALAAAFLLRSWLRKKKSPGCGSTGDCGAISPEVKKLQAKLKNHQ